MSRRAFLQISGGAAAASVAYLRLGMHFLSAQEGIDNPLLAYPNRDWERLYRDQYAYDDSFTFVCAPNDTHMCRLRAFLRNGVVTRIEQNYDGASYGDPQGNTSTVAWNPRGCPKGYTLHRRVYGPYRAKYPMVRAGWKEWADDGFPSLSDDPSLRTRYRFDARGDDDFERVSWDEVDEYLALGLRAIAETYSGDEGERRLLDEDGYEPEMLEFWEGSGVRTMKFGSSLPVHGVAGKFSLFRFANMLSLLDADVRGVGEDEAVGGREWSEYTWRGDQAPGFPFVHGLQSTEVDMNDMRRSRLVVMIGKNLVENKMPDSHWFHEVMERGGKIVSIVPEYGPPSTKSDYWIPVRAGLSDTALVLGIAKALIDRDAYDERFLLEFTDMPLLVRLDTLQRLRADELFGDHQPLLDADGPSFTIHGMTAEQYEQLGDRVVWDRASGGPRAISREDVGTRLAAGGIDPQLDFEGTVTLADGTEVRVASAFAMYREHLADYDLDTVVDITGSPRDLIEQLVEDFATIKPAAIHIGEGINHYFHATLHNRACYLVAMLVGSVGIPGGGVSTWAGNYKGGIFHGAPWHGPGVGGFINEDPFHPLMDPDARYNSDNQRHTVHGEETSYWGYGDRPLVVDTPAVGRKVFTGRTHLPTPTKVIWYNNANLINQAKWAYHIIKHVNPKVDLVVDQQIEWTGSAEFADIMVPANSWLEARTLEMGGSCSNPFLQIWQGGLDPLHDTRDDIEIFAGAARALTRLTGDERFGQYFEFSDRPEVYLDRVLAASFTTEGYTTADVLAGRYGEPGGALFQYRTYPRVPFLEQIRDSLPFYTDTGRLNAYVDIPEAIEYGENLIVHREAVEATRHLPNVIVSTSRFLRPEDYGIDPAEVDADMRQVRNIKMSWQEAKATTNPLFEEGYRFLCLTPKSRHSVHSSWAVTDWHWLWASNFGDPYRTDTRMPGVGEPQIHMNPDDARDLGLAGGDYVWVDASSADRPFIDTGDDDAFFEVARLQVRLTFNPAYPRGVTMLKHAFYMATPRTFRAQAERDDHRALAPTGYQSSFRSGSQQSVTRGWAPPMHQTDTLFHKRAGAMAFVFGFDVDNHAINTTPKETLIRVTKAAPGGVGGQGRWWRGTTGRAPGEENARMQSYLSGGLITVRGVG
ncbi:MAG: molybdopterin-dependent oxidoreductase [Acidimicrobiales bacterium]